MVDIFIIIVAIWALWNGWRDGLVRQLVSMIGLFVGLVVAATCYSYLGEHLTISGSVGNTISNLLAFFILWIIVPIVLGVMAKMLTKVLKEIKLNWINSILGAGISLFKYLILLSCVFNVMLFLHLLKPERVVESHLFEPTRGFVAFAFDKVSEHVHKYDASTAQPDTMWIPMHNDKGQAAPSK